MVPVMTVIDPEIQVSTNMSKPQKYEGFVLKKKKWPLKGWHTRYFCLDDGFLKYAKTPREVAKNKLHGLMDMGMSVLSTKKNALTIDLDAEDTLFHLKLKSSPLFQLWVSKLRLHRDFRLYELKRDATLTHSGSLEENAQSLALQSPDSEEILPRIQQCINEPQNLDLLQVEQDIASLGKLFGDLQFVTMAIVSEVVAMPPPPPSTLPLSKKERKAKKISKKSRKHSTSSAVSLSIETPTSPYRSSSETTPGLSLTEVSDTIENAQNLSRSNPDLSIISSPMVGNYRFEDESKNDTSISKSVHSTPARARPATFCESSTNRSSLNNHLRELTEKQNKFLSMASKVQATLSNAAGAVKHLEDLQINHSNSMTMKSTLSQLGRENQELKARLQKIHSDSSLSEPFLLGPSIAKRKLVPANPILSHLSSENLSITETGSELFYDAEEYLISEAGSSTDEESETCEDEASSGLSDESETTSTQSLSYEGEGMATANSSAASTWRRKLPCHKPNADVSLWNILKKNIGKDLSKVTMPVTLNEPLNALQLLCEEVEYSDLLDKASGCDDQYERMVYVAAFAISAYGSTHTRAGQKPFNPILGETYECIRSDKSFRFVSEQVSHHPPISACHCDGGNFEYWQDLRFKNKFWGKSMEIFPMGSVHVRLKKHEAEYRWKKVTSCVHNIMSGTRWVEHYGDMVINCGEDTCKISFSKSGYWSNKNGEVTGVVTDGSGVIRHTLHGKWFEGIYCDIPGKTRYIWRPHPLPADSDKQYGFTRFAIELNEIDPAAEDLYPRTDTRFRPDQRCLEEGDVEGAEKEKVRVEQLQREQKKQRDQRHLEYEPYFFKKVTVFADEESWIFKGDYWSLREDPGFKLMNKLPKLW